ncbi:hypothetical protein ILUMI_06046, partial [Ignelater luminosus]
MPLPPSIYSTTSNFSRNRDCSPASTSTSGFLSNPSSSASNYSRSRLNSPTAATKFSFFNGYTNGVTPSFFSNERSKTYSPFTNSSSSSFGKSNFTSHRDDDHFISNINVPVTNRLPPPVPSNQHIRRITPVRRAHTTHLESPKENIVNKRPVFFETRPLKNLTVVSHSEHSVTPVRSVTRSPSPSPSLSSTCTSVVSNTSGTPPPRRIFPQVSVSPDLSELEEKEDSSVVFDANLTFVLGCKTKVKQHFKPLPAYVDTGTASNYLSNKIYDFLKRTDHVMDEWKHLGHKDTASEMQSVDVLRKRAEDRRIIGRSRSANNIMIKGFQLFSRASSGRSSATREISEDRTEGGAEE